MLVALANEWENWRQQGLTQHRNWWPDFTTPPAALGIEPDPAVAAYSTTYQTVRADLKELTGSA